MVSGEPKPEKGGNMMYEVYRELIEEDGDFHIPAIKIFKVEKVNEGVLIHAIEDQEIGRNVWLEERYINALLELEECGSIETLDACDIVEMYEVHDLSPHKTLLAIWSYKLLKR